MEAGDWEIEEILGYWGDNGILGELFKRFDAACSFGLQLCDSISNE